MMSAKILCVDDDSKILRGFKRQLASQFTLETAEGGEAALATLSERGPFAVVVSDMRMPGMDGVELLKRVAAKSPDTVRMMLTGNADLQTAIQAVNEGHIFRFLTKPCEATILSNALKAGLEQYRLIRAEHDLLRDTLTGSIKVLTDIVAMLSPAAFGKASRMRRYVKHVIAQLQLSGSWEFEIAAALSQIGCVTLPPDVLDLLHDPDRLGAKEQELLEAHPAEGRRLLENIPRLRNVAQIIGRQNEPYWSQVDDQSADKVDRVTLGAQLLHVALHLDQHLMRGQSFEAAWRKMASHEREYNPEILEALMGFGTLQDASEASEVTLAELTAGMIACENICGRDGNIIIPKGHEITYPAITRLRNMAAKSGIKEPIKVQKGGCAKRALAGAGAS